MSHASAAWFYCSASLLGFVVKQTCFLEWSLTYWGLPYFFYSQSPSEISYLIPYFVSLCCSYQKSDATMWTNSPFFLIPSLYLTCLIKLWYIYVWMVLCVSVCTGGMFSIKSAIFLTWTLKKMVEVVWRTAQENYSASFWGHGEGSGTPLQYSCLENPMDEGAWWATVHGVVKSRTRLRDFPFTFHFHALEKEMSTHSSILA